MYCANCGQPIPDDANFCPHCGAPVSRPESADRAVDGRSVDQTTASIEVGALDRQEALEDVPELRPGTGMLAVVRGPNAGSRYLVDRDTTTIGRHPDSHIFLDDVTVSRRHAEVERDGDTLSVIDLGSLNGTYVNGERVDSRELRTGDEVQVGRFKLRFVGASAS